MFPLFKIILFSHIATGIAALLTGAVAMYAQKRQGLHTKVGTVYFYLVTFVCFSAALLAIMRWKHSSFLFYIAIFSYAFAILGYGAIKLRPKNWLPWHIFGMLGSYTAMVTAALVVSGHQIPVINQLPPIILWFLPTVISNPIALYLCWKVLKYQNRGAKRV